MAHNLLGLRTRVRRKLKDNAYNSGDIDDALNEAQQEISTLFQWPFLERAIKGTLSVGKYTYEQQSNHQLTLKLILLNPNITNSYNDISDNYLDFRTFFSKFPAPDTFTSSLPYHWTEFGDQIWFDRPVDLAYSLRQFYIRTPELMVNDSDVPEFPIDFSEALILGAQYRCEEQRDNYDYSAILQRRFEDKVEDLIIRYANRQGATADVVTVSGRYKTNYFDPYAA